MSSRNERFECHWQASRLLLAAYLSGLALALIALLLLDLPPWAALCAAGACLLHAAWVVPRRILLRHPSSFTALRRDARGWMLFNARDGWQAVQLRPDSLALPVAVILRFRLAGQWRVRGLCVPRDALPREEHRRLRVRLRFSRRRWAVPG